MFCPLLTTLDTAVLLPTSPAVNVVTCVVVLPLVAETALLAINVGAIVLIRFNTATILALSLAMVAIAVLGCTTVERNSSPMIAV